MRIHPPLIISKNSTNIMTGVTVLGIIGSVTCAIIETKNARDILADYKTKTMFEKVSILVPAYKKTLLLSTLTVASCIGTNVLNHQQQASMTSAYMLLDQSFKEFRQKVTDKYGEEAVNDILADCDPELDSEEDDAVLFYEPISQRYFRRTMEEFQDARYHLNRNFVLRGYCDLNEFYRFLAIPDTLDGYRLGWSMYIGNIDYGYEWIDIETELHTDDSGLETYYIWYPFEPTDDFINRE